jgi:hypothetical protein
MEDGRITGIDVLAFLSHFTHLPVNVIALKEWLQPVKCLHTEDFILTRKAYHIQRPKSTRKTSSVMHHSKHDRYIMW